MEWSSASSTRKLGLLDLRTDGQSDEQLRPIRLARPDDERAVQLAHALFDPEQAHPPSAARIDAGAVVRNGQLERGVFVALLIANADLDAFGVCVAGAVRERLLHDAIDARSDLVRQRV